MPDHKPVIPNDRLTLDYETSANSDKPSLVAQVLGCVVMAIVAFTLAAIAFSLIAWIVKLVWRAFH
jgi:hypothetical protein